MIFQAFLKIKIWKQKKRIHRWMFLIENSSAKVGFWRNTVLYWTILYCTILYCAVLSSFLLCCTVLCWAVLCFAVLYCTVLYFIVLYRTVLYRTVFSRFSLHCYTALNGIWWKWWTIVYKRWFDQKIMKIKE